MRSWIYFYCWIPGEGVFLMSEMPLYKMHLGQDDRFRVEDSSTVRVEYEHEFVFNMNQIKAVTSIP